MKNGKAKKNRNKSLSLILLIVLVIALALISFQLRARTGFEPEPVAEEIAPHVVFSLGPVQVTTTVVNTWIMIAVLGLAAYFAGKTFKIRPGMVQNTKQIT